MATTTIDATERPFVRGAAAMLPWLLAVAPFGMVIGITVADSSVPLVAGWASGLLIYSGSAQLVAVQLLDDGAAAAVVVVTVLVINARLALYGASIAPNWRETATRFRLGAAYLLVDPSYVVGVDGYERWERRQAHRYYLGTAITLWVGWQASIVGGSLLGGGLPEGLHLELVVPLFLLAEAVPRAGTGAGRRAATTAAVVAVAGAALPMHAGLLVAIGAGMAAGGRAGGEDRSPDRTRRKRSRR